MDATVTEFTTAIGGDTTTLLRSIADFSKNLTDLMYDIDTLDDTHKNQIRLLSRGNLILLRSRLERFSFVLAQAIRTPDI